MTAILPGRGEEVAFFGRLVAELPTSSAAVMVRGEAGIGKTALVESVLEGRPDDGLRVLRGACAPMAGAAAYSGLDIALGAALSAGVGLGDILSPAAGRARALESLRQGLEDGPPGGTVLLVEDAHWADWSTLDFLAYLTRNLPVRGLLVILTWRDEVTDADREAWLAEQLRSPRLTDVQLRRLTAAETALQVRNLRSDATLEEVERIHQRSAGNPYLTAELATLEPAVPASLRRVLLSRLQLQSPAVRTLVAAAATLARPLTDGELLAVAGGEVDLIRRGCEAGILVRDPNGRTTARHPVLAEVAYESLLRPERQQIHARLARHLKAHLRAPASPSAVAEVAEQYHRAGDPTATLRWSISAARAAEARFALAEAGHWYAIAAAVVEATADSSDMPSKLELAQSAATNLGSAGQRTAALTVLDEALAGRDDTAELVPALLNRSWLRMHAGDSDAALRDAERARCLVPPGDELLLGRTLANHALVLLEYARYIEAAELATAALELALRSADTRTVGQAKIALGIAKEARSWGEDPHQAAETSAAGIEDLRAAMSIARQVAEPDDIALAGVGLSSAYLARYQLDELLEAVRLTQRELRRYMSGRHWLEDMMEYCVVIRLYELGRWDEALSFERSSATPELPILEQAIARIRIARGELRWAGQLQHLASVADRDDQPMFKLNYAEVQCELCLRLGRADQALALAIAAAEVVHGTETENDGEVLLLVGLEAAVAEHAPEAFERLVDLLRGAVGGVTANAVDATIEAERSRIGGASDPERWLTAAREWSALGHPYPEARARLRAAEAFLAQARVAGSRARAASELETARFTAESLGAAPLREQIDELAKLARIHLSDAVTMHGGKPDAAANDDYGLTDRERAVLALLADGKTNREIGAALYMSPKTASVHVTHILAKLSVRSRVQAAAIAVRLGIARSSTNDRDQPRDEASDPHGSAGRP
ncbi:MULTISPECIES: helix-turn-helix transcriptional regulator [unclassified Kribbella]|uniref:helix-turn-helix transcriptional regulator n=1 Tax=unclassified Kribbella TaxID=2644121 RepID=UPI003077FC18